jgi:DNA-binding IscR family transcriptional regulator
VNSLVQRLGVDVDQVENILAALKKEQLIVETTSDPTAYLMARDIETIALKDVYDTVRGRDRDLGPGHRTILSIEEVEVLVKEIDEAIVDRLGQKTIKDIVLSAMQPRGKTTDHCPFNGG